jgi:hypothetical protein
MRLVIEKMLAGFNAEVIEKLKARNLKLELGGTKESFK